MQINKINNSEINCKKTAYRSRIRRDWLEEYFVNRRQQIHGQQIEQQKYTKQLSEILISAFKNLPSGIIQILELMNNQPRIISKLLMNDLKNISNHMKQCTLPEWDAYIHIINSMIMNTSNKQAGLIAQLTLCDIIVLSDVLVRKNKIMGVELLSLLMGHLIYSKNYLIKCTQLQIQIITKMLVQFINLQIYEIQTMKNFPHNFNIDQFCKPLIVLNNFITLNISNDQKQNQKPQFLINLQFMKLKLIKQVLFKDQTILRNIIQVGYRCQQILVLDSILTMLVNLTHFLHDQLFYYRLMDINILTYVNFMITITSISDNTLHTLNLVIRLLNNIVVTSYKLTQVYSHEIMWSSIVGLFYKFRNVSNIVIEVVEFFINVVNFMSQNQQIIYGFIQQGIHLIIISSLGQDYIHQDMHAQLLSAIMVMLDAAPLQLRPHIFQKHARLQQLANINDNIVAQVCRNLLISVDLLEKDFN